MTHAELLRHALERVVERVGDPASRVYERLFSCTPELRDLFVLDLQGSARGEMFHRAVEALLGLAGERQYAPGMIAAEWSNHRMNGVTKAQFDSFFQAMGDVFREALGDEWTANIDHAWRSTVERAERITAQAGFAG